MKKTARKNAAGLTPADIARLSPRARQQAEAVLQETGEARAKAKEKWWLISFFSKRHKKRLAIPFPIQGTKGNAVAEAKGRQSGDPKDNVNWHAKEVTMRNPATPFFCADCDSELKDKAVVMGDGRSICPRCALRARDKRKEKSQRKLFDEQTALFQNGNPGGIRNVEMGFVDRVGVFHPVRRSKDYNEFRTTDVASPAQKRERSEKYQSLLSRDWHRKTDVKAAKRFMQQHKSLSQFVRASGGIAYKPGAGGGLVTHKGRPTELALLLSPKATGTTGLLNQHNRQGAQRFSAEYMMDAANAEGYRDRHGAEFDNIGNFVASVADDASGTKKLYSNEDWNDYYANPMKKTAKGKGQRAKGRKSAGKASAPPKKNLFGLGKKKKPSKGAKRRTAKRTLKADRLEARARYLRSLNPAQRTAVMKAEKNPGALDTAVKLAAVLSGAETAQKLLRGKKDKGPGRRPVGTRYYLFVGPDRRGNHLDTKPEAVAAARSLANQTGGAVTVRQMKGTKLAVVKTIRPQVAKKHRNAAKPKARRNSSGEIFEDFTGKPSTQVTTGYVAANAPKNVDLLGPVRQLTIENGRGPVQIGAARDGTARTIMGEVKRFNNGAIQLCAVEKNGKRRFVVGVRANDRAAFLQKYPWANGKLRYAPVAEVVYEAAKPHLYNGDRRVHQHYHILGEEGGRRPTLYLENGCPSLRYGDYDIKTEGIRN